jgi:ParB-like chromosome segregation protein Spo0J
LSPPDSSTPYQLLPPMADDQFAALKADIAERGVLVAVEVDQDGQVLDGHHRLRAWEELRAEGVRVPPYTRVVRHLQTEEAKLSHALRLNLSRRHLNRSERAEVVAELSRRGMSQRRIAVLLGVGRATVARDLEGGPFEPPAVVEGKDGKHYRGRPKRPPTIVAHSDRDEARARQALTSLGLEAPNRPIELRRAEARVRERRLRSNPDTSPASGDGPGWSITRADIASFEIPDQTVDLVLTDPPYQASSLSAFSELGAFCARALRPGRLLVCYAGKFGLPEEIARLSEQLVYVWAGAIFQPGRHVSIHAHQIRAAYRQVLFFSAGPYQPRSWVQDTILSGRLPSKDLHPWQQALEPASRLVASCSAPGELVCDPFLGSGTTAVAAVRAGRRFVGCDVDARAVNSATERLDTPECRTPGA